VWLRFLDDYVVEDGEQNMLWKYLKGQRQTPPNRTEELLWGCQAFVSSLASTFHILNDDELGPFGLIHSYWLQKFFGYKRDGSGFFVKNTTEWGRADSWAQTISKSQRFLPAGTDPKIKNVIRRQFVEKVELLGRTFEAVRRFVRETRALETTEHAAVAKSLGIRPIRQSNKFGRND